MPTVVANIRRDHVEVFIERLVATKSPATANSRYGSHGALQAVELWEEGRDRLHDRLRYQAHSGGWRIERSSPETVTEDGPTPWRTP